MNSVTIGSSTHARASHDYVPGQEIGTLVAGVKGGKTAGAGAQQKKAGGAAAAKTTTRGRAAAKGKAGGSVRSKTIINVCIHLGHVIMVRVSVKHLTLPKRNRILPAFVIVSPLPSVSPFLQSWSRSAFLCATARAHAFFQCLGSFVTCATNSLHSAAAAFWDLDIVYWKARIKHP